MIDFQQKKPPEADNVPKPNEVKKGKKGPKTHVCMDEKHMLNCLEASESMKKHQTYCTESMVVAFAMGSNKKLWPADEVKRCPGQKDNWLTLKLLALALT